MAKGILFEDSFLVSGIMCYESCGLTLQGLIGDTSAIIRKFQLPPDCQLKVDAEPYSLGVHRLIIRIESEKDFVAIERKKSIELSDHFKSSVSECFEIFTDEIESAKTKNIALRNWVNIITNMLGVASVVFLATVFPPSIYLTLALTTLSFAVTGFTIRSYMRNFFQNLRSGQIANMSTSVTLGWFFSLLHTLYHALSMPLMLGASMTFMCFVMPITLIIIVNIMDEINRLVIEKAQRLQLQGMKSIFPEMAQEYDCLSFPTQNESALDDLIASLESTETMDINEVKQEIAKLLQIGTRFSQNKNSLTKGSILQVKRGECFPVDSIILLGHTMIDSSLLNGEPHQPRNFSEYVPAGAINLEHSVTVYAMENPYNSTVNKLLFRANRATQPNKITASSQKFSSMYTGLVILALGSAVLFPLGFGVTSIPLILQNLAGVLFAICPCTIAISHQLPRVLAIYYRNRKNIVLRNENCVDEENDIHTFVFDKTGTLTTGKSEVASYYGISKSVWQRIFLLERNHGGEHPIAKAICDYYLSEHTGEPLFDQIVQVSIDAQKQGISGKVQGKMIHIGNSDYLQNRGIIIPKPTAEIEFELQSGKTPIYIAENSAYQGLILIKHEVRPGVFEALKRLKDEGKKILLLTGDTLLAANAFNQQNGSVFERGDIHAKQTPTDKENFLTNLLRTEPNPQGVCFVGDGLNDAPCARIVSEKGGMSCAMSAGDKAAFFTDLSLNGSLDYLFKHKKINAFLHKNIKQNQNILLYGIGALFAFMAVFSSVGIALSAFIPMLLMTSTTLLTLFNCYRVKLVIDTSFDKQSYNVKEFLASDSSITLLVGSSSCFLLSLLLTTYISGGAYILPPMIFTAGVISTLSSLSMLVALGLTSAFVVSSLHKFLISAENQPNNSNVLSAKEQTQPLAVQEAHNIRGINFWPKPAVSAGALQPTTETLTM